MANNQPPEKRQHPLEARPAPPVSSGQQPRQQVTLRIPSVRPSATYAILAINIAIFVARALSRSLDNDLLNWGANGTTEVLQRGEYYRLLTSMFLHASIYNAFGGFVLTNSLHLIFNAYVIYGVGTYIERLFGHTRFLIVYILGGLAGSVASVVINALLGQMRTYSVGASGAVFALIGAEFIYLYYHRKLLSSYARARMQSLITFGVINLLFGFATSLGLGQMRVDNWAHIGGLAGGLILGWFISPIFLLRRHPDNPEDLLGEDANPLKRRYWVLSVYIAGLLALLIVGVMIAN